MNSTDRLERNRMLNTLFDRQFFRKWNPENKLGTIELIVTADCDMQCEYCYIHRYGDKLYPKELRNSETILDNLEILLNWIEDKRYYIETLDIFSGEFFAGELGFQVLEKIYQHALRRRFCGAIVIPSNFSFIGSEKRTGRVEEYFSKFEKIGISMFLSCSIDGKGVDGTARQSLKGYRTDEYYDKVFSFSKKHQCGFHPMASKEFVANYKECFDWWVEMLLKHFGEEAKFYVPMLLEVRNDTWDTATLSDYSDMLWYIAESSLKHFHKGDVKDFVHRIFHVPGKYEHVTMGDILKLPFTSNRCTCSIQSGPVVRLGDLALVPCHRTMYPEYHYGRLAVENGKIVGVEEKNVSLATKIYAMNPNVTHPKCSGCAIKSICLRGCLGSQLEVNGELFAPVESVCDLMYTKFKTLHEIYGFYHAYQMIEADPEIPTEYKRQVKYIKGVLERI